MPRSIHKKCEASVRFLSSCTRAKSAADFPRAQRPQRKSGSACWACRPKKKSRQISRPQKFSGEFSDQENVPEYVWIEKNFRKIFRPQKFSRKFHLDDAVVHVQDDMNLMDMLHIFSCVGVARYAMGRI